MPQDICRKMFQKPDKSLDLFQRCNLYEVGKEGAFVEDDLDRSQPLDRGKTINTYWFNAWTDNQICFRRNCN